MNKEFEVQVAILGKILSPILFLLSIVGGFSINYTYFFVPERRGNFFIKDLIQVNVIILIAIFISIYLYKAFWKK